MFSKTIFKQTLNQNWKLWAVFTAITSALGAVIIAVFDPRRMQRMMEMMSDVLPSSITEQMGNSMSLLGMMSQTFYSMQAVILPLIFVIMTANSLVASQIDRGSMAYTLSTPIKRTKVISTQAIYMITSLIAMIAVMVIVGLTTVQIAHRGLWGTTYTDDVVAAAKLLNLSETTVSNDLTLILNNPDAVITGADARGIDEDVYIAYLNLKLTEKAFQTAAEIMEIEVSVLNNDPVRINENERALNAAAEIMGVEPMVFSFMLDQMAARANTDSEQTKNMQDSMMEGITAAAEYLHMEASELANDMKKLKDNPRAMEAAVSASGLPQEIFIGIINQQLANDEISFDKGINFVLVDYLNVNIGLFLLMFAIASISFLFSCIFNLTKNSLALGAGIPVAFFVFQIMGEASNDLEFFKYLSLNTLYDPAAVSRGGTFLPQFIILAILGAVLYLLGIKIFKEKDLPL